MNIKAIIYHLSFFCFPISALSFINILYSSYFDYFLSVESYTITLFISFALGIIFFLYGKKSAKKLDFFEQLILIIFTYFVISIFISIPYYLSNYQITLINALFESFSGLTTTGFTIFDNIKYLDPTLILWRSSSQWIGGIYFLIFLILIFSNKQFEYKLTYLTYNDDGKINSISNIKNKVLKIFLVYLILSFIIFIFLNISGVRLYNALNLSMSLISTGAFLPTNYLSQIIKTNFQEIILILSFLISILNIFFFMNLFNKRKIINEHQDDIFIFFIFIICSLILLITNIDLDFSKIIIGVLSSLSNSGITTSNVPDNITLYFLFLTLIGGSLISNTSGIKLTRIYILLKSTSSEIIKLVRPNNIVNQKILFSDKKITSTNIKLSFLIFISFFISVFILSGVLLMDTTNFESSFKLSILTLTNTSTSALYGVNNIDFSGLLTSSKISLIIFMIVGKIELISFFLIIKKFFLKN